MSWRTYADWAKQNPYALRLADQLGRGRGRLRWLDTIESPPASKKPDLSNWHNLKTAAVWIGHATVLLRIAGITILTDPVFSTRIGIGMGLFTAGPRRLIAPALEIADLPPLDLILISHAHFDHLDRPSLTRLPKSTPVVTASKTSDLIADLGFRNLTELRWGESTRIGPLTIRAHEVRHWGARTFFDTFRGYNGYFLEEQGGEGEQGGRILYAGDTAYQELFQNTGKVNLAIFGIAAYNPYIRAHATPEQAWEMANDARADFLLPIHHSTFRLSHEPMEEPMQRMLTAAGPSVDRIAARNVGSLWHL